MAETMPLDDGPVTIDAVIAQLKHHRFTHTDWADWLEKNPNDPRADAVGNAAYHRRVERHYNRMIEFLEGCVEPRGAA